MHFLILFNIYRVECFARWYLYVVLDLMVLQNRLTNGTTVFQLSFIFNKLELWPSLFTYVITRVNLGIPLGCSQLALGLVEISYLCHGIVLGVVLAGLS